MIYGWLQVKMHEKLIVWENLEPMAARPSFILNLLVHALLIYTE